MIEDPDYILWTYNYVTHPSVPPITEMETTSPTLVTTENTTKPTADDSGPVLVIAVAVSLVVILLLLLVGVVVVVLVLWRCRHQHTAKEEASHTSSQTHTHSVVSLCEETGQVQYVSEQQDTDQDNPSHKLNSGRSRRGKKAPEEETQLYSTLNHDGGDSVQKKKKGAKPRTSRQEEEMQEYSTLYHGDKPPQALAAATKGLPNNDSLYDKIDHTEGK